MKDALVAFCGCLQMRKVLISTMEARTQISTRLHGSILDTASKAWVRVTHSPTTHATVQRETEKKMQKRLMREDSL